MSVQVLLVCRNHHLFRISDHDHCHCAFRLLVPMEGWLGWVGLEWLSPVGVNTTQTTNHPPVLTGSDVGWLCWLRQHATIIPNHHHWQLCLIVLTQPLAVLQEKLAKVGKFCVVNTPLCRQQAVSNVIIACCRKSEHFSVKFSCFRVFSIHALFSISAVKKMPVFYPFSWNMCQGSVLCFLTVCEVNLY